MSLPHPISLFAVEAGSRPPAEAELDAQTLAQCRAGDTAATRRFVLRYQRLVFGYLSRVLGPGQHVDDLAQEAFLRALRALPRFDPGGPARLSTWVLTITARLAIDARRRRAVEAAATGPLSLDVDDRTPEDARTAAELRRAIADALAALPVEQREVFVLVELHGWSHEQIAEALGVAVGTVKSRASRARERLRELLGSTWQEIQ